MKLFKFIIASFFFFHFNVYGDDIPENIIVSIEINGIQRIEKETVVAYSNINLNDIYTEELGNDALKSLFETDLFSNIEISFKNNSVIITIDENPTINLIKFEGNKKINDEDLLLEIYLKERSIYSRSKIKKDVERMLTLYQRGGRLSTEINPTVELLDNNRVNLTYEIDESDVAEVSNITIVGNNNFSSNEIKSVMKTKQKKLLRPWSSADNYDPDKLEYDKQLITEFYNDNGFPEFKFTSSIAQLIPNKNSFEIILTVIEGEKFNFGVIEAETKLDKLSVDTIVSAVSTKEGSLYQGNLIRESVSLIRDQASTLGYTFIEIYPDINLDYDSKSINLKYVINEGPRVYLNTINITGNTRTIDRVIRRQIELSDGDAYNKYAIDLSKNKIRSLNFFSVVEVEEEKVANSDRLNINLHVEEKNTGEVSLGAGYSSAAKTTVSLGLKEQNFLGKGQKAKFSANFADTQSQYDISFEEPYFNNKTLNLRGDLYSRFSDPSSVRYETEDLGVGFGIGFPLSSSVAYRFSYELFTTKIKADANASVYENLLAGTDTVSSIGNNITYDKRNSPYKPSSGSLSKFNSTIAGLGGTSYYIKNSFDYRRYKRLSKSFVGAFKIEGGHLNGYNDKYAPINANYKLGGKNLRGFKSGRVGPKSGDSYYGGQYYYLTSLETNIDLPLDEFDITSIFFVDAGSVWGLDSRYGSIEDDHNLRSSLGVNVNWDSAIGPINLIYAKPLIKEDTDTVDSFYFDIGYNF
mgnify:CR=1 FL=1